MTETSSYWVNRALQDGHLQLMQGGRSERIRYVAANIVEGWSDPEEKVRAAYFAELIYRYGYGPEVIGVEVTVPDRVPHDRADLVIFRDKGRTRPFAVIECKRDGITDTELRQAVEQSFGNGHAHKFRAEYIGVIAGQTRAFYDCSDRFGVLERETLQARFLFVSSSAVVVFRATANFATIPIVGFRMPRSIPET